MGDDMHHPPPRRHFLRRAISVAGAAPLSSRLGLAAGAGAALVATAANAANTPAAMPAPVGYQCFSADEAAFTETMVNVMCPADQFTPNGVDCGLAIFIDRQLSGAFGQGAGRYMSGPWREGKPELGLQLPLTPEQFYKAGVQAANHQAQKKFGKTFDQLPSADADAFLNEIAGGKIGDDDIPLASWFNDLVYPLFTQACYADPLYGGNGDKVFWKMIGYPGLPATHTLDMVDYRGKPYPGAQDPKSILDFG
ncbi:gluconate 2-dehydrogenase subunit 3 family protein [Verminephrobacter eiseniae]|nr:gluconate 2-dehydrogenase subunit 3 family protein [Verminephrobacter eiseniae]MCW8183195.1 gluconate 2-dehydrogenase subunit 3 family protein [Verminephrobacter eiseniae]MCW8222136.1 gluconate 2-dehydrogenase subunit 3 family protein [Verminephrobacter eiseniae]MCW8232730.1 gluconate 2-dehydrogenase subunit 3 family protein [Verminephrobacter eiseniae]